MSMQWQPEPRAEDVRPGYLEAVRAFCEGHYALAHRQFESVLLTAPEDPRLLAACGHACLHNGETDRALDYYERALVLAPHQADALFNRALIEVRAGRRRSAAERLRSLLDAPPLIQPSRFYLGLYFRSVSSFQSAVALQLGDLAQEEQDIPAARGHFETALAKDPSNVTALQRLGELSIRTRNYIEATKFLEQVLEVSPLEEDRITAHNSLGIACYDNGDVEQAIQHFTWVLQHSPGNPTAIRNLHYIYDKEGIFRTESRAPQALRLVDAQEGASPIFSLSRSGEAEAGVTVIGRSAEMLRVMRYSRVAAAAESPALLRGERGTGKSLLARLIALNSRRADGPFLAVDCTSTSEVVLESELFGHEKGAFTGARARKQGALERAAGGTLFLQEVAALTPMLQGKLYRALHESRYTPMGATQPVDVNVRVIAATSRDLAASVKEGSFREDLFYLLNVVTIEIPPLRERREDVPVLVDYFLEKHSRHGERAAIIPPDDLRILSEYDWPGNVRELENLVERAIVLGSQSALYLEELARLRRDRAQAEGKTARTEDSNVSYPLAITLADLEKRHILSVLKSLNNNQRQAAKVLGINPSTLWRKLRGYGIETEEE